MVLRENVEVAKGHKALRNDEELAKSLLREVHQRDLKEVQEDKSMIELNLNQLNLDKQWIATLIGNSRGEKAYEKFFDDPSVQKSISEASTLITRLIVKEMQLKLQFEELEKEIRK
ncbi:unnamed protein product [Dracunculus medinensis]|uniref:Trigger_C domain-containing protein n=1 Tax=Dracunculus medinensis TaxID=318479 RepID=A0A0N4U598_DRAME|nr:unnamed protein product [Dracunculus medinensis]